MSKHNWVLRYLCCMFLVNWAGAAAGEDRRGDGPEPNAEIACKWWPEFENVWTPIGWKDHFLRFNVLYNGTVVAEPRKKPYVGQGVQVTFIPTADGSIPEEELLNEIYRFQDRYGGVGNQGWWDFAAPVLWTEWRKDGLILRNEIFGHIAGGGPVRTGIEPLYAWMRLTIKQQADAGEKDRYGWLVKINKPYMQRSMWRQRNLIAKPEKSAYPGKLSGEVAGDISEHGYYLVEEGGKVRLGIAPGSECKARYFRGGPYKRDVYLHIEMPVHAEAHVDLLLPMLPVKRAEFDTEMKLGFQRALAQSNRYWSQVPETAARVVTPEKMINDAVKHCVKLAEVISLRHPGTGQYTGLLGSWHYEAVWATPTTMVYTMMLDSMGYHSAVERYLEVCRQEQGKRSPPGDMYKKDQHPGYLSAPKAAAAIDWLSDHGAILYAVCNHGLLTDDKAFVARWTDAIIKACEFIKDKRALTGHGGIEGILPPAVATDRRIQIQAVWNDGWSYKGLSAAVRLLDRVGHPRADEFAEEARDYKEAFVKAFRESAGNTPKWVDNDGREHHYVPTALPEGGDTVFPFYLDTGPLFLVYAGLMDAGDPLMRSAVSYFREGPNVKTYDINGAWDQPICLHHEVSSCEPCYSWNVFHSYQLGDRYRFLEGMYSLVVGTLSRQTFIGCEHRGGISGTLCSAPIGILGVRLAVVDDQIEPGRLHLLRLVPLAWLSGEEPTIFENMPTEFGPVTLLFILQDGGGELKVTFKKEFRRWPKDIILHVPPLPSIRVVNFNGQRYNVKSGDKLTIR